MTAIDDLSGAHVLLLAVQALSAGNLATVEVLVHLRSDVFDEALVYRLLLSYYPTDASDQDALVAFVKRRRNKNIEPSDEPKLDASTSRLSQSEAIRQCQSLTLQSLPQHAGLQEGSDLANFVIEWAQRLESLSGAVQPLMAFVEEFVEQDASLRFWHETYLLPVVRLQYSYYPDDAEVVGVQELENLEGLSGVKALLKCAEGAGDNAPIGRDLEHVVAPWISGSSQAKRRKIAAVDDDISNEETSWENINEWLLSTSTTRFELAAKGFDEWNGPTKEQLSASLDSTEVYARLAQTGFAIIYACQQNTQESMTTFKHILAKAVRLSNIELPDLALTEPDIVLASEAAKSFSETDLLFNSLLRKDNTFTKVTETTMLLLLGILATNDLLSEFKLPVTVGALVRICVFGSEQLQKEELRKIIQMIPRMTRKDVDWVVVRRQLLWLRTWMSSGAGSTTPSHIALLGKVSAEHLEIQILDAILLSGRHDVARDIYAPAVSSPLSLDKVEGRVVAAIYEAYDNASNGNRDRGGMRRAYELLKTFQPSFPQSQTMADIDHLIRATHSLSFYQLTLQHGVPFRPVSIRVQKDPLALVGKVLEQDTRAYTKLDDLLEIGRHLVLAHLPSSKFDDDVTDSLERRVFNAEHKITFLAITAALAAHDFDTAYAYITSRLSTSPGQNSGRSFTDDTSWRAAYAAGKYRPDSTPKSLQTRIANLSQRMELLSRALTLAPTAEPLSEILGTWRRCEEEMDSLKSQAIEEERAFEAQTQETIPGGFGMEDRDADVVETKRAMARRTMTGNGPSYEEEAPLGLFDVARGAASALRKSAFPLGGAAGARDLKIRESGVPRSSGTISPNDDYDQSGSADVGRVRKRDMVSNMVTSGLVSGMGWVLGAQPVNREDSNDQPR